MRETKKYTVVILFNSRGSKILLQTKNRTKFAGMLNGVGGMFDDNETPEECAYREIEEETSLKPEDIDRLTWLGTLTIPEQCDEQNADKCPELWFFSGIVADTNKAMPPEGEEELGWYVVSPETGRPIAPRRLAGDGDLEYFIKTARRLLFDMR